MQRPAVVTGRKVGGAHHRERGGGQHGLRSDAATQLLQRPVQDVSGGGLFDELDQWLDVVRKFDACVHHGLLAAASAESRRHWLASLLAGSTRLPPGEQPKACSDVRRRVSIRARRGSGMPVAPSAATRIFPRTTEFGAAWK